MAKDVASGVVEGLIEADIDEASQGVETALAEAGLFLGGQARFLNETVIFEPGRSWSDPARSQLWRYQLHYFGYALSLGTAFSATGNEDYFDTFRTLADDWIKHNPYGRGDGWHPYTISLRVVHWIYAFVLFRGAIEADAEFKTRFLESLALQVSFLRRHLEYDVGGNHLLENLRALLWAGLFFRSPVAARWAADARRLLEQELLRQVLADGGHFERTPMYHSIVLWDLMEMIAVSRNAGQPLSESVERTVQDMTCWLAGTLHPDGEIALFNDAVFDEAPSPGQLGAFEAALWPDRAPVLPQGEPALKQSLLIGTEKAEAPKPRRALPKGFAESGFYSFGSHRGDSGWALFDAGEPCPPSLPAHAHCDLLSYELSLGEQRFIVNSGVYQYAKGPWREFCRSTRAHNTVVVDGAEQSEVWDSFRVARRAHPRDVQLVRRDSVEGISAAHDGYSRLPSRIVHRRIFALVKQTVWLVLDEVTASAGSGVHHIESMVHWHPSVRLKQENEVFRAEANGRALVCKAWGWENAEVQRGSTGPIQGWYCPEFGAKEPNDVITFRSDAALPFVGLYALAPNALRLELEHTGGTCWAVIVDGAAHHIDFSTFGLRPDSVNR